MALGKRAFLFPSDTLFRSGRAPRKGFKYERPLFFENTILAHFRGVLWFSVGMDSWIRDKSFCILYQQKDTEAVTVFFSFQTHVAHFSLISLFYTGSLLSVVYIFYLH